MGNNLDKVPKAEPVNFPFVKRADVLVDPKKNYNIRNFSSIAQAGPNEKHFLASQVIEIFKASFSTTENFDYVISYYFYFTNAHSIDLHLVIDKKTNQPIGFSLYVIKEEYLEAGNYSEENRYFVAKGLTGIRPEFRKSGLYKELSASSGYLFSTKFNNTNFVVFDLVISPAIYHTVQKIGKWIFPGPDKFINSKQLEFMLRLRKSFFMNPISESNPFLVHATTFITESEKENWNRNYQKLSPEMKYHIDQTQLTKNVGLLYMLLVNLREGNTFGLPAKQYITLKKPDIEVYEHTFISPKL